MRERTRHRRDGRRVRKERKRIVSGGELEERAKGRERDNEIQRRQERNGERMYARAYAVAWASTLSM